METGLKNTVEFTITEDMSAARVGSGALNVFATPTMIAMMEKAALECVQPYLEEGQGTVGILINVTHDAATPIGMKVRCEAELTEVDGRRLAFKVEAFDDAGHIGGGTHERFIVFNEKFQAKTDAKL